MMGKVFNVAAVVPISAVNLIGIDGRDGSVFSLVVHNYDQIVSLETESYVPATSGAKVSNIGIIDSKIKKYFLLNQRMECALI